MLFDMEELNKKLDILLQKSLDNGVPIVYADKKYTKGDEMIKEFPSGRRIIFKRENGKKIFIREIDKFQRLVDQDKPRSAAEQRLNNKPAYIDTNCPKCGSPLILIDLLENPLAPTDEIWNDEFTCPKCRDGIYLDVPSHA